SGGTSEVSTNGLAGTRSLSHTLVFESFLFFNRTLAFIKVCVAQTPTRALWSNRRKLTAAFELAFCTGPISWMGYQYWLKVRVSHGPRNEKSGWLSVKTPAINSTYGPSSSVKFLSHV